jgi:hypothetical protein
MRRHSFNIPCTFYLNAVTISCIWTEFVHQQKEDFYYENNSSANHVNTDYTFSMRPGAFKCRGF